MLLCVIINAGHIQYIMIVSLAMLYILYAFYTNLQYYNYLLHIIIFNIYASPYVIPSPIYIIPTCVPSNLSLILFEVWD